VAANGQQGRVSIMPSACIACIIVEAIMR